MRAEYNLYLDLVFLQNFLMDLLLLVFAGRVLRRKRKIGRIAAAGCLGALWACMVTLFPIKPRILEVFLTYGPVSFLMTAVAFRLTGPGEILKAAAGLYLAAVLLAGGLELLQGLAVQMAGFTEGKRLWETGLPFLILFFSAGAVVCFVCFLWERGKETRRENGHLYTVRIYYRDREETLTAFLDTGNRLRDPVSRCPVSIVFAGAVKHVFEKLDGITYLPYRSVGKEGGMLPAVWADRMIIEGEKKSVEVEKPLIALSKLPLSADGAYQMLLHETMWEEGSSDS